MQNIQTTLAYTDESLADGHGFVRISFPEGKVVEEICLALMKCALDEQSGDLVKDKNGEFIYEPGIEFLFENGGCKDLSAFMKKALGDESLTETMLAEIVYRENSEVFKVISDQFDKVESVYPAKSKEAFKVIVLSHMKTLEDDYWTKMRTYPGGSVFQDENNAKVISREQVVKQYLTETALKVGEYLTSYKDCKVIGEINGQSVFFSRKTGIYFYSGHDESLIILEIWITGGGYPPNY